MKLEKFPWADVYRLGVLELRLSPNDFWTLTPRELAVLLGSMPAGQRTMRAELVSLMNLYPDKRI